MNNTIRNILDTLPTFIAEMDADWDMTVDYVMSQIQPTIPEWAMIEKVYDEQYLNITDQVFEPFNTFCMQTAHLSPKQKLNNKLDKTIFLTEALIEQCNDM